MVTDKTRRGTGLPSDEDAIEDGSPQEPNRFSRQRRQKGADGGPDSDSSAADLAANKRGETEGGYGNPSNTGESDDAELQEVLQDFIGPLVRLLEPRYVEVVWRAEVLGQPPVIIAKEMNLSEPTVATRLQAGRRALLHLVELALQPTPKE